MRKVYFIAHPGLVVPYGTSPLSKRRGVRGEVAKVSPSGRFRGAFIALLIMAFSCIGASKAKAQQSLDDSLRYYLRHLSLACCGQGAPFLYDMAVHVTNTEFYTPKSYDTSDFGNYLNLYNEMFYSAYDTGLQPNFLQWYGIARREANDDTIPIGIFDFQYNKFKDGVFDSINNYAINPGDTNAWFAWNNDSIYNGRAPFLPFSDAYKINPATHNRIWEIFAASPLSYTANFENVLYSIDPQFIFANPAGLLPGGTVEINFGDGAGWRTVASLTSVQYYTVFYPSNGVFLVQVAVVNDGDTIKRAESRINVLRNTISRTPDNTFTIDEGDNATVSVYYGCGHTRLERPFVYLKGIDPLNQEHAAEIYTDVLDPSNLVMLRDFNYDFVIVDWANSTASIESNASIVTSLLGYLTYTADTTGSDSNTQFVVMGESMGGVIGRYALSQMETPGFVALNPHSHNTRLFINLDGPQEGAFMPLGLQHIYGTLAPSLIAVGNDVATIATFGIYTNVFHNLLARPAVRELLIYNDYDRTGAGTYPEDAMRATLLGELNTLGYPKHCKTVTLTNGLLDSPSRQVTFHDKILRTGMPYFNFDMVCNINIFPFTIPLISIQNFQALTNPGFDSTGIILQGSITTYPFNWWGCLKEIFSLGFSHTGCLSTVTNTVSVTADSVQPLDIMPGGQYSIINDAIGTSPYSLSSFLGFPWQSSTVTPTSITYNQWGVLDPLDIGLTVDNYIDHFCFIPRFSALGYRAPYPLFPADHDIMTDNIDTIVNRIPFDVAVGWYSIDYPDFLPYGDPYGDNSYHLTVRADSVPSDYSRPSWLNREVGDDVMNLDNLNINRKAMFSVRDSIIAGWSESPYYTYPNISPFTAKTAMYSKQDSFIVDSLGGDVTFRAGHRIILDNGFKAKFGSRFHAVLDSDEVCTLPYSALESPPPFIPGNNNGNNNQAGQILDSIVANKTTFMKVYPNPSTGIFNVLLHDTVNGQINVQVLTTFGKNICNFTLENCNLFIIDASKYGLAKGVYILKVQCEGKVYTNKLMVN